MAAASNTYLARLARDTASSAVSVAGEEVHAVIIALFQVGRTLEHTLSVRTDMSRSAVLRARSAVLCIGHQIDADTVAVGQTFLAFERADTFFA